jgi:hypothetical protein
MKARLASLLLLLSTGAWALDPPASASALPAELAPAAEKHQKNLETLESQRQTALTQARKTYLSAIDAAELAATNARNLALVAVLEQERQAVETDSMPPAFPPALPAATMQVPRRTYLESLGKISAAVAQRKNAADAEYMQALIAAQGKAEPGSDLARIATAEKQRLLAGLAPGAPVSAPAAPGATPSTNLKEKLTTGRFIFHYDPPRSKPMTFGQDGAILEGAAGYETTWKLEGSDLLIYSDTGLLSHALTYSKKSDSFKTSSRNSKFKARGSYLENAPEGK